MKNELNILKGIHPGFFLANELRKRKIPKGQLALQISEYPQVIGDIANGKRRLSPRIALKLDNALNKEEGFFMLLQAWHDIIEEKRSQHIATSTPDLSKFRSGTFWDTDINQIDWNKQYRAVIQRIFERGNEEEKEEISRFYEKEKIKFTLASLQENSDTPPAVNKRYVTL